MPAINSYCNYFYLKLHLSILLLLLLPFQNAGQGNPVLGGFQVYEADGKVYLNTIINAGSICNGITIFRSADNINFSRIGDIPGDCGSQNVAVSYIYIDESPILNKPSYYKVELGGYGFSEVATVLVIDTRVTGFQVRPNPADENAMVYFENKNGDLFQFELINNGKIIYSANARSNFFSIPTHNFHSGTYFFRMTQLPGGKVLYGKLIIVH